MSTGDLPASQTVIVTGADGFVGRHVCAIARSRGHRVIGITRAHVSDERFTPIVDSAISVDLTQRWPDVHGDCIIHLAGLAAVGPSFDHPQRYIDVNSRMITMMGETLLASRRKPRIVGVSSGAVYDPSGSAGRPLDESTPTEPTSPYAVSKLLMEAQLAYYRARGLDVVIARPFNHIGPGQARGFLLPDLVAGLRALAPGEPLAVGSLTTARDYTDVRDVAMAYILLAEARQLQSRVYNVASGTAVTGMRMLELASTAIGRPVPHVEVDPGRVRSQDAPLIRGDASLLQHEVGWSARVPIVDSVQDYARARHGDD